MRKRRNHLQVTTFPFLAVLLCAMGALILVLLAMDRRGRLAARAKAAEKAQAQYDERQRLLAEREASTAARKAELEREWEEKKKALTARLDSEQKELDRRLADARARMAEAARKIAEQEEVAAQLRDKLADEKAELARREAQAVEGPRVPPSAAEAERLAAVEELAALERAASALKQARERDASTYSVVPYRGKHGASRRPVYVECAADSLLLHPGGKKVAVDDPDAVRAALVERLKGQGGSGYLLALIRPDGIRNYYALQAALKGVEAELGYEMVDAGWKLDFPEEKEPPTALVDSGKPALPPAGLGGGFPLLPPPGPVLGEGPGGKEPLGKGDAGPGAGGGGASPGEDAPGLPPGKGPRIVGSVPRGEGPALPGLGQPSGGSPPMPHPDAPRPGVVLSVTMARPVPKDGMPQPPALPGPGSATAPPERGGTGSTGGGKPGEDGKGEPGAKGKADAGPGTPGDGPKLPGGGLPPGVKPPPSPKAERPPLRPAELSSDEVIVHVECHADYVVVHPSRRRVPVEALGHSDAHNPLYQQVRAGLARKPLGVEKPRRQIRFLVHPDGERTFHRAYPVLEGLSASKTRQAVQPGDDVMAIIAGR